MAGLSLCGGSCGQCLRLAGLIRVSSPHRPSSALDGILPFELLEPFGLVDGKPPAHCAESGSSQHKLDWGVPAVVAIISASLRIDCATRERSEKFQDP